MKLYDSFYIFSLTKSHSFTNTVDHVFVFYAVLSNIFHNAKVNVIISMFLYKKSSPTIEINIMKSFENIWNYWVKQIYHDLQYKMILNSIIKNNE